MEEVSALVIFEDSEVGPLSTLVEELIGLGDYKAWPRELRLACENCIFVVIEFLTL